MAHFVFLEFSDPKVRDFLTSLRSSLAGRSIEKAIHVTVRGPYETYPDRQTLDSLKESLQGFGVTISGAGTFNTKNGYAVFLRVMSPVFSEIWWKPDFNIDEYGINPHVTVFETPIKTAASKVEKFLRSEKIQIFTLSFALTVYTSKQLELFDACIDISPSLQKTLRDNFGRWKVKRGIMQRAATLHDELSQRATDDP